MKKFRERQADYFIVIMIVLIAIYFLQDFVESALHHIIPQFIKDTNTYQYVAYVADGVTGNPAQTLASLVVLSVSVWLVVSFVSRVLWHIKNDTR